MTSTIPRFQYNKTKRGRPPPIPISTRPKTSQEVKYSSNAWKGGLIDISPGFSTPTPPPMPRSPRPTHAPSLLAKRSMPSLRTHHASPIMTDDYTINAISDDHGDGHSRTPSEESGFTSESRLQKLMNGLGLGVKVPNIPPTPVFVYPKSVAPPRKSKRELERAKILATPNPGGNIAGESRKHPSPYSEISHEIERMHTEFLTPKIPQDSYASAAKQAIADSRTPPYKGDRMNDMTSRMAGSADFPPTESESSSIEELRQSGERDIDDEQDDFSSGAEKLFRELSTKPGRSSTGSQRLRSSSANSSRSGTNTPVSSEPNQHGSRTHLLNSLRSEERRFVATLRDALNIFALPLRLKSLSHSPDPEVKTSSPGWIDGLPAPIGRLFDWLEDIVVVHERLLIEMDSAASLNVPVHSHSQGHAPSYDLDDCLMNFVTHLEVYQGYLVRCEAVIDLIEALVEQADNNDFGEFVLMQSKDPICKKASRNLSSYLRLPIARLAEYPVFFKNMLSVTPHSHPSYITTLALYHSCKTAIEVLNEVKRQEEEYEVLKQLEQGIQGLDDHSSQWRLAKRERRLVAQGLLKLVLLVDDDGHTDNNHLAPPPVLRENGTPRTRMNGPRHHVHFKRTEVKGSLSSSDSSIISEYPQTDSTMLPGSTHYTYHPSPSPRIRSTSAGHTRVPVPRLDGLTQTKEVLVYAFVFGDIVLFTLPNHKAPTKPDEGLTLMRGIGVSKILAIQDVSGQQNCEHLIRLDLLPVISLAPGVDTRVTRAFLTLPDRPAIRSTSTPSSVLMEARKKWLAAFWQCHQSTIRSLSYSLEEKMNQPQQQDFLDSLEVIRSAGLPMPKSPSQQMIASPHPSGSSPGAGVRGKPSTYKDEEIEGEREERGFWSLRFQMVMKERRRAQGVCNGSKGPEPSDEVIDAVIDEPRQRRISAGGNGCNGGRENARKIR